jgi:hypothetical protein
MKTSSSFCLVVSMEIPGRCSGATHAEPYKPGTP